MNKVQYICPRIGIVDSRKVTSYTDLLSQIKEFHGKYFELFNLTSVNISSEVPQIKFKWRGTPFSISLAVKILNKLDQFLRKANGNCSIFFVDCDESVQFARLLVREYARICQEELKRNSSQPPLQNLYQISHPQSPQFSYFSQNFLQAYRNIGIDFPPVKVISSFQTSSKIFIPTIDIYSETRYNELQKVFTQKIENELGEYYFNLDKPLENSNSTGKKYYDRKPEVKFLSKPVIVCGDVKIECYSYNTFQRKKQFSCGFNTRNINFCDQLGPKEGIIQLKFQDLFQKDSDNDKAVKNYFLEESLEVYIGVQNWCSQEECSEKANCSECFELSKKIHCRYHEAQSELNKFNRRRTAQEVSSIFS